MHIVCVCVCGVCPCLSVTCMYSIKFLLSVSSLLILFVLSLSHSLSQSFYIRASSKSKYALSVRLDNAETPVMHYLIYCNAQGFYGIQGSNLQFVSLYDMLAYFCFQQR